MTLLQSLQAHAPITLSDLADLLGERAGLSEDQTESLLADLTIEAERLRSAGLVRSRLYQWEVAA